MLMARSSRLSWITTSSFGGETKRRSYRPATTSQPTKGSPPQLVERSSPAWNPASGRKTYRYFLPAMSRRVSPTKSVEVMDGHDYASSRFVIHPYSHQASTMGAMPHFCSTSSGCSTSAAPTFLGYRLIKVVELACLQRMSQGIVMDSFAMGSAL